MTIEAMKLALDALEWALPLVEDFGDSTELDIHHKAITAAYTAIEQAEKQEPYGYLWFTHHMERRFTHYKPKEEQRIGDITPIYTAPPQREWVGLTEQDILQIRAEWEVRDYRLSELCRAIEAKLKEKNT